MTDLKKKAVFSEAFHWSRPGTIFGFGAEAGKAAQEHPADFIDAAVAAGVAVVKTMSKADVERQAADDAAAAAEELRIASLATNG